VVAYDKKGHCRIWQFSDMHLFADGSQELYGVNCNDSFQRVLTKALSLSEQADFCLLTGDLAQDETEAAYQRLLGYLDRLAMRSYCLPGNHDADEVMRRVLSTDKVSCNGYVLYGRWLLILLDTTISGSNAGHLSEAEFRRADGLVKKHADKHVLLVMHHPPLVTKMAWLDNGVTLDNPECVHHLVAGYSNIRGVVWGHVHHEFQETRDDVLWLACPSTMAQFKPNVVEFELDDFMPGFRCIELWDDGAIETHVIRLV